MTSASSVGRSGVRGLNVHSPSRHRRRSPLVVAIALGAGCLASVAMAAQSYTPSDTTMSDQAITLNGHDLTIEQIVNVARHGAQVQLSADARQRELDNYGLLLEATAEKRGGEVTVINQGGALFTVRLPLSAKPASVGAS